ncbi:MAG: acetyl-CoA carboxylase carboxyl transferase subunit beta, partial [Gammaproteobacteria bacterium]|nr:acetyl-CoA carboxylase carboxyl transferase subunit beta [Gammaproteobacteria bacterium]
MTWYEKVLPSRIKTERRTRSVPEGLWIKCPQCSAQLYRAELERNLHVCPKCSYHMRLVARDRLMVFLDPGTGREIAEKLSPQDPLRFKDTKPYRTRIIQAQKETGERDALVAMTGMLKGQPVVACAFEFRFMGG